MPHLRKRYVIKLIEKIKTYSPLVGLLGHRQVGKTTVVEGLVDKYLTFDDEDLFVKAQENAKLFLSQIKDLNTGIDECQLVPKIFPALKERVRQDKRPGQFILTGSVRFTSKKAIQESLTGRIMTLELLPLTVGELRQLPLPTGLHLILKTEALEKVVPFFEQQFKHHKIHEKYIDLYHERGGLPGICFIQDEKIRNEKIQEQLRTILDRDLREIFKTTLLYSEIKSFLAYLAEHQGEEINSSQVRRQLKLSPMAQKKLLYALESVFLIRSIPVEGKAPSQVYYLEDQAEATHLAKKLSQLELFEQLIYRNLRAEFFYQIGESFRVFQYKTRGAAKIPFCFETQDGVLGILPIIEEELTLSHKASIKSFLSRYLKAKVLVVTQNSKPSILNDRVILVPFLALI